MPSTRFEVLAPYGRIMINGAATGELVSVPVTSIFGLSSIAGFNLTAWRMTRPAQARAEMDELAELFATGKMTSAVHATVSLEAGAEAHRLLDQRSVLGRALLQP